MNCHIQNYFTHPLVQGEGTDRVIDMVWGVEGSILSSNIYQG